MNVNKRVITIDFDDYFKKSKDSYNTKIKLMKEIENKTYDTFKEIKTELNSCHVNKHFESVYKDASYTEFEVIAKFNGKKFKLLSGVDSDFHDNLFFEVVGKFFYNLNSNFKINPESFDFIRRISIDNWINISQRLEKAKDLSTEEVKAFEMGYWDHPVFREENWPLLALKTYFLGGIDRNRVATLFLYHACFYSYENPSVQQLIDFDGNINPEAKQLFESVFLNNKTGLTLPTDEQKELVWELFKQLPPQETQFFLYKPNSPISGYMVINEGEEEDENVLPERCTILGPQLFNTLLKGIFKNNAIISKPVLGQLSLEQDFTHKSKRDVLVFFPQTDPIYHVHNYPTEDDPLAPYFHDLYHCLIESLNPDRVLWLKLAAELQKNEFVNLRNEILDRNFAQYAQEYYIAKEENRDFTWDAVTWKIFLNIFNTLKTSPFYSEREAKAIICLFIYENSNPENNWLKQLLSHDDLKLTLLRKLMSEGRNEESAKIQNLT